MGSIQRVRRFWLAGWMILVLWLVPKPLFATQAELTAALDLLPEKAPLAIVIPNAKSFSDKVAQLARSLGVPSAEMRDLLGTMKSETGLVAGLREEGPLILAMTDTAWFEKKKEALANPADDEDLGGESPAMVALVPVKDAASFMNNLTNLREEEGLTVGTNKDGEDLYMKAIDGFVALSDHAHAIRDFAAAKLGAQWIKDAGTIAQKTLDQADIVVLADMRKLAPSLLPLMEDGIKVFGHMMKNDMAMQPGLGGNPAEMAMAQAFVNLYGQAGTALVRDTQVVLLAANLSDKGLGLSMGAQFKPDSFLGKALKNGSPAASLLAKTVNQNYLFASALSTRGIDLQALLTELQTQLNNLPPDTQEGQKNWAIDMMKDLVPAYEKMTGMTQVMYLASQPQMGSPLFNVVSLVESTDAKGFREASQKALLAMNNFKLATPTGPPGANMPEGGIGYTTSYTPNALQVEGVSVDQFSMQMQLPPEAMENNPALPFMMMMGVTGQTGYIAQVGDYVVSTSAQDVQLLGASIKMLKSADGLGESKLIVESRKALAPSPMMEGYFNLAGVAGVANAFIPMMGMPPIQVPADLPPVAMGVSLQDSAMIGHTHVPMSVMTFVRDTIQQMQGGPQQPPPSGSAPRRRQGPGNAPPF